MGMSESRRIEFHPLVFLGLVLYGLGIIFLHYLYVTWVFGPVLG